MQHFLNLLKEALFTGLLITDRQKRKERAGGRGGGRQRRGGQGKGREEGKEEGENKSKISS